MSERLRQFVLDVSNDLDRAKRLAADPAAELDQSDLSPEDRQTILSRDPDAVRLAIGADRTDMLAMSSFFIKKAPKKPGRPSKPGGKRGPGKPRKPARKAPTKRSTKKTSGAKRASRKTTRKTARKTTRKATRKSTRRGSRGRRG